MSFPFDYAISLIWLAWLIYWWVSSCGTKAAARVDSWGTLLVYRVPLVIGVLLMLAVAPGRWWPWLLQPFLPVEAALAWIGMVLLLLGLAFACWARVVLGRNWSATVQLKQDHELVTAGPYHWVRHPIYTGVLLGLLGTALVRDQWRCLLALAIIAAAFWYKLRHEEAWMREQFGTAYVDYMRRTKALIPGVL
ncbi:methyltransferase family protein [Dyella flagellata]|nr:isoprenylcysteine carboxylmethyltransferase family protein [Dyella flagellata]